MGPPGSFTERAADQLCRASRRDRGVALTNTQTSFLADGTQGAVGGFLPARSAGWVAPSHGDGGGMSNLTGAHGPFAPAGHLHPRAALREVFGAGALPLLHLRTSEEC